MTSAIFEFAPLLERSDPHSTRSPTWSFSDCSGRVVELSGTHSSPHLTVATALIHDAQMEGEPCAWVGAPGHLFYPPDIALAGVDLEALVVVRAQEPQDRGRVADKLLRSGAFGLVVIDLGGGGRLPMPLLSRLVGLATKHGSAVVLLTEKAENQPSVGSLVSLRVTGHREKKIGGGFACSVEALKDKRHGPGWRAAL